VQVEWLDFRSIEEPALALLSQKPPIQVVDYRQEAHPYLSYNNCKPRGNPGVGARVDALKKLNGHSRYDLIPGDGLAIWTTHPVEPSCKLP